jgi:signal transduction histidine kinase
MRLRTKILAAELPPIVVLAMLGLYAVRLMLQLGGMADRLVNDNYRSVLAAQRMERALDATERLFAASANAGVAEVTSLAAQFRAFESELVVQEHNITEEGEDEATRALRASFELWRVEVLRVAAIEDPRARWQEFRESLVPKTDIVRGHTDHVLVLNQDAMIRKANETKLRAEQVSGTLALVSVAGLALVVAMGVVFSERLARPLTRLAASARLIGAGNLDVVLDAVPGDDEVARLVREFESMTQKLRTYRQSSLGELIEASEAAQAAIDSLADPVITFNEDGSFRRANEAASTLLKLAASEEDPLRPIVPELRRMIERVRDRVLQGKGPQAPLGLENAIPILVEGRPRSVQPIGTPIYSEMSGAIVGVTVLVRDVTSLRRADELKNDLLATVAHELRTPLTSIRMALHLCLEQTVGPLTPKQDELLSSAREEAERLHRLVEGILSVSKIEAGVLVGRRRAVEPVALVDKAVGPFRIPAADRKITLVAQAPHAPRVEVDQDSVVLVLTNMLQNALKHTPEGGRIELTVDASEDGVYFNVRDTGPGIAPEHRPRLFEKFYRVPGSPPGGTGLGLSIARDIVFAHDGEIGIESELGKGSRFWFRLPVRQGLVESGDTVVDTTSGPSLG